MSLPLNPVVLKDVAPASLAKAAKGIARGLDRRLRSGALTRLERDRQRFALRLGSGPEAAAGADLVIEAVFENLDLKKRVLAETERVIAPDAVYASNTSALPIRAIAAGAAHPERVVGMHYFSPVPKMPLLEVVVSEKTADWAAVTAQAYGVAQGKTVIVVRDGPGFYTSRILVPYMNEAIFLLEEGAEIRALDEALVSFGFPVGPVTLLDEVGIDIAAHVSRDLGAAFVGRGVPIPAALPRLVEAGLLGRKSGRGFFLYPTARTRGPRPVNAEVYAFFGGAARKTIPPRDMADRLSLLMANEAVLCLAEGVIASARDGDVGAILGLGFPPFRGGPFRHLDALGAANAVARMNELTAAHGPRFTPAPLLTGMAADGRRFHAD